MSAWMVCDKQISVVINKAIELGIIEKKDAQRIGQTIVNNNVKSLVSRYGNRELNNKHKFQHHDIIDLSLSLVQAHKYARSINYQCCEYRTWKNSSSYKFLKTLSEVIESKFTMTCEELEDTITWSLANWRYKD